MHYTITRAGDTWLSLAKAHFGSELTPSLLEEFITLNQPGLTCGVLGYGPLMIGNRYNVFCSLPPNLAIWLPQPYCSMPRHYQSIKNLLNSGPPHAKPNLARLEAAAIRPHYALAATIVTHQIQHELNKEQNHPVLENGAEFVALFGPAIDNVNDATQEAVKSIKTLDMAMQLHSDSPNYAAEIHPYHVKANEALNKAVAKYALQHTHFSLDRTLRRADAFAAFGERGFVLANDIDARRLLFTANNLRLVNMGMTGLDVAFRVGTVFETYKEGGNWQKETGIQAGEYIGGKYLGGAAAIAAKKLLKLLKNPQIVEGGEIALEIGEGVTLAALGPEIAIILVATAAGYGAETLIESIVR